MEGDIALSFASIISNEELLRHITTFLNDSDILLFSSCCKQTMRGINDDMWNLRLKTEFDDCVLNMARVKILLEESNGSHRGVYSRMVCAKNTLKSNAALKPSKIYESNSKWSQRSEPNGPFLGKLTKQSPVLKSVKYIVEAFDYAKSTTIVSWDMTSKLKKLRDRKTEIKDIDYFSCNDRFIVLHQFYNDNPFEYSARINPKEDLLWVFDVQTEKVISIELEGNRNSAETTLFLLLNSSVWAIGASWSEDKTEIRAYSAITGEVTFSHEVTVPSIYLVRRFYVNAIQYCIDDTYLFDGNVISVLEIATKQIVAVLNLPARGVYTFLKRNMVIALAETSVYVWARPFSLSSSSSVPHLSQTNVPQGYFVTPVAPTSAMVFSGDKYMHLLSNILSSSPTLRTITTPLEESTFNPLCFHLFDVLLGCSTAFICGWDPSNGKQVLSWQIPSDNARTTDPYLFIDGPYLGVVVWNQVHLWALSPSPSLLVDVQNTKTLVDKMKSVFFK